MMLPISSKETVRYTPPGKHGEKPPVYLLAVPSIAGRAAYNRELTLEGVMAVPESAFRDKLREAIPEILSPARQKVALDLLDTFETECGQPVPKTKKALEKLAKRMKKLTAEVDDLEREVVALHPGYARLLADHSYNLEISAIISCRLFLKGFENIPATFETDTSDRVTLETLGELPPGHLQHIAVKIQSLLWLRREQEKN